MIIFLTNGLSWKLFENYGRQRLIFMVGGENKEIIYILELLDKAYKQPLKF